MAKKEDFTRVAHAVFMQATGAAPRKPEPTAKQITGRKGGLIGGKKRMDAMTEDERARLSAPVGQ